MTDYVLAFIVVFLADMLARILAPTIRMLIRWPHDENEDR